MFMHASEEIHNKNRVFADHTKGTFAKVLDNLNKFQQLYPDYVDTISFNAVFDEENNFKISNDFFSSDFMKKADVIKIKTIFQTTYFICIIRFTNSFTWE